MFESVQRLPNREELKTLYPSSNLAALRREEVAAIIGGRDKRLLLIAGPCSMDSEKNTYKYVENLLRLAEKIKEHFLVVPRLYTSKPRSLGGFRGLIHSPDLTREDMFGGIVKCRKILSFVLNEFGVCGADEVLYPELFGYFDDLLAYSAVGARSSENQQHRMFASGLDMAVGFKNPLSGSVNSLVNSVLVARSPNIFASGGEIVKTSGNNLAHAVFRGYTDIDGKSNKNTSIDYFFKFLNNQTENKINPEISFLVDVSHDNSGKNYLNQPKTLLDIAKNLKNSDYKRLFRGVMMESYLIEGKNDIKNSANGSKNNIIEGRSFTDGCLSLAQTERAIMEFLDIFAQ